jgi:hypothetical protein
LVRQPSAIAEVQPSQDAFQVSGGFLPDYGSGVPRARPGLVVRDHTIVSKEEILVSGASENVVFVLTTLNHLSRFSGPDTSGASVNTRCRQEEEPREAAHAKACPRALPTPADRLLPAIGLNGPHGDPTTRSALGASANNQDIAKT